LLFELYLVCVFSYTVLFVGIGQVIGCEDRLRNDPDCVGGSAKLNFPLTGTASVAFSIYVGAFCIVVVCRKVISRIYYCVNRSWSGRIILVELSKSNLLQVTVAYRNIMISWKDVVHQPNDHCSVSDDYLCSTHP